MNRVLSPAQIAVLRCIADTGQIEEFYSDGGYGSYAAGRRMHSALWFGAADKVVNSLIRRGDIRNLDGTPAHGDWELTEAGRAEMARAIGSLAAIDGAQE